MAQAQGTGATPGKHSLGMMSQSSTSDHRGSQTISSMFLVMTYQSHNLGPMAGIQRSSGMNMVIVDQNPD